jgi:hypothetical protein
VNQADGSCPEDTLAVWPAVRQSAPNDAKESLTIERPARSYVTTNATHEIDLLLDRH